MNFHQRNSQRGHAIVEAGAQNLQSTIRLHGSFRMAYFIRCVIAIVVIAKKHTSSLVYRLALPHTITIYFALKIYEITVSHEARNPR